MMNEHLIKPDTSSKIRMSITPETAGWTYLSYAIVKLGPGETHEHLLDDQETAIVPLEGSGDVTIGDIETTLSRTSVFDTSRFIVRPLRRWILPGPPGGGGPSRRTRGAAVRRM